jgi:hypothetical protein
MKEYRKPDLHRLGRIADMTRNNNGNGADGGPVDFNADQPPPSN